ncbi:MAG TPA: FAD-binding oxidoreductase, partial [Gemmatimonadales bacterium]|nr:FAD-binding oxidoreductase [Gemmatimonadales bacterium]
MSLISTNPSVRARFSQGGGIHRIVPAAVAGPRTQAERSQVLDRARQRGMSITMRGAGSAMSGSSVGEGLVIDMSRYEAVRDSGIMPGLRLVQSSPATSLGWIAERAVGHGLRLGPDPSSAAWATVGGTIGTNAAGPRSFRWGAMDRWVADIHLETADGYLRLSRVASDQPTDDPFWQRWHDHALPVLERHRDAVMARWPKTRKNTAGYALDRFYTSGQLIDLVTGSEGTLGLITSACLFLQPIPSHRASIRAALGSRRDLAVAVAALAPHLPSSIEFLDRTLLRIMESGVSSATAAGEWRRTDALILSDFEADDPAVLRDRVAAAQEALRGIADMIEIAHEPAAIDALWQVRHRASSALAAIGGGRRSLQVIEDGCVPPERLGDYLDAVSAACEAVGLEVAMFGHAGDGHAHVNLLPDLANPGWLEQVSQVFDAVQTAVIDLGGTTAGEHGAGRLRAGGLERLLGPEAIECFAAIK